LIHEKDLEYHENMIVTIEKKELTWRQIENYKNNLGSKITSFYTKLQEHENEVNRLRDKINILEEELKKLNSQDVKAIVSKQREDEKIANQRAMDLLREHIGIDAFTQLMEKHYIHWTTNNSMKYKMTDKGKVFRRVGKEWQQLCIIRPKSLPLPDSILAILVSVKENPSRFQRLPNRRTRR
jgi:lipopolysaccharide biosynthesis regulator YciM